MVLHYEAMFKHHFDLPLSYRIRRPVRDFDQSVATRVYGPLRRRSVERLMEERIAMQLQAAVMPRTQSLRI
jgi:hypothetical protein